ncbi:MAG: phenylalanine--tRNA ligase subunit beta [Anaerolineales bacterium]
MKAPLSWLKDFVDIDLSIEELAYRLTMAGLEVEAVHYAGLPMPVGLPLPGGKIKGRSGGHLRLEYKLTGFAWEPDKIVVGAIHEVVPHPNADRLILCKLDDGEQMHTVLTGAPNLRAYKGEGPLDTPLKVAYAREGATIIDAYNTGNKTTKAVTLKRRKIRGVDSYSMACSERELGISDEHEGIIILDDEAPTGVPLAEYMGDAVFDIAITPNIARDANILGIAREIAAITGKPLKSPQTQLQANGPPIDGKAAIDITTPTLNPRFVLGLIENVEIKPSPYKVQLRLRLAGQRPINNIVDATNYAMLEIGEPLHAFDYDILVDRATQTGADTPTIITRAARQGERLRTLDDVDRELDDFTVLVCDQSGPLALAGVMGGAESEVNDTTRNVLLEGASWNMINTRRTLMAQKLSSEAAYRFSRGVHPAMAERGVLRGLALMHAWGGGTVYQGLVDNYPLPPEDPTVEITPDDVRRWLGIQLTPEAIIRILESLEFKCTLNTEHRLLITVTTPDHRLDIGTGVIGKADLMEEIARIYGYDNIPETRMAGALPRQLGNPELDLEARVRDLLVNAGLQEIITYRMTTPEAEARRLPPGTIPTDKPYLRLINPITSERAVMRQSLLASVLEIVARNARIRDRIAIFEIGDIFLTSEGGELPDELSRLVIALTGPRALPTWQGGDTAPVDFYDLKGIVGGLLSGLHLGGVRTGRGVHYEPGNHPCFHPGKCANVILGENRLGTLGELHPQVAEHYDLPPTPILIAKIDMDLLLKSIPAGYETDPVPTFPPVLEDLAFVMGEHVPAANVERYIRQTGGRMVAGVHLFDVYRGDQLGAGQKSLAYRITYQSPDKTLKDKDVAKIRQKIVRRLERELGAKLRSV